MEEQRENFDLQGFMEPVPQVCYVAGFKLACSRLQERRAKGEGKGMKTRGDWGREKEGKEVPPRFRPLALSFARLSRSLEQARFKQGPT